MLTTQLPSVPPAPATAYPEDISLFVFLGDGSLTAWDHHENKSFLMICSYWLQVFMSYLIVEMVRCSIAAVVWVVCYIQARPTADTSITAALFRYKVGFSICCLTFLWQQKF